MHCNWTLFIALYFIEGQECTDQAFCKGLPAAHCEMNLLLKEDCPVGTNLSYLLTHKAGQRVFFRAMFLDLFLIIYVRAF